MKAQYPDWLRWYKKPSYVDVNQFATNISDNAGTASNPSTPRTSEETKRRSSHDIPSKLGLERILKNRTCMHCLSSKHLLAVTDTQDRQSDVAL